MQPKADNNAAWSGPKPQVDDLFAGAYLRAGPVTTDGDFVGLTSEAL